MLEGLEIIIISKSDAFNPFFKARLDPEFFQNKYVIKYKLVLSKNHKILDDFAFVTDGEHGNAQTFPEGYSKYYGARNVLNGILNDNGVEFITKEHHLKLRKTELKPRDLLISCVGANIGYAAIVPDDVGIGNIVRNVALIRSKNDILNEYLHAYFLSKYGKELYIRMNTGNAQPLVSLDYINTIPVFIPSNNFQLKIKALIERALLSKNNSKDIYEQAENLLLGTLGLKDFQPNQEPVNIKNFSESFGSSGRLDAEYYQVKYEQVVNRIKSTDYDQLLNLVKIKKSIEPGSSYYSDEGLPFVRVSDYDKFGLSTPDKYLNYEFCKANTDQIKKLKPKKETILFSKDGSVGTAYMLREDANFITSGAILHLTVKDKTKIIPEYLTLALNSKLVQMQAERDAGGSIILHWRVSEIEKVVVPIIDFNEQREIADLVEESFKLKKQSEHLLEAAKTAVEMAIEKDEKSATDFINEKFK